MRHQTRQGVDGFGRRLFQLGQSLRWQLDAAMRQFGLTDATWRPLLYMGRHGDGIRQTDLANALEIEGPSLVRLLDTLERQALVRRENSTNDRRVKTMWMTAEGRAIYEKVADVYDRVSHNLLEGVPDEDLAACLRVFDHIDAALKENLL